MADKKPAGHGEGGGSWLGLTLPIIAIIALVAVYVYGVGTPFSPTFLNLDYLFGKMLEFFTFFTEYNVGIKLKIFIGFVVIFLIALDFYLLLRILEMEEEHVDHAYHHAVDEVHHGAKPTSLFTEFAADMNELADDAKILARRTAGVRPSHTEHTTHHSPPSHTPARPPVPPPVVPSNDKEGSSKWRIILKHINSNNPSDWKLAIIEADTILDGLVERAGFPGDTLGERMKNADPGIFRTLKFAKEAHFIRNRIAHDGSNFILSDRDAKITIRKYEEVFREFDYI